MMKKFLIVASAVVLSACATSNPDVVRYQDTQRMATIQDATILSMRPVTVDGSQSGAGVVGGAVIGSVAGASTGHGWRSSNNGSLVGMVAGALIGNAIERSATRQEAFEIVVQLRNGERRSVIQAQGEESLSPGDAVVLTTTGGRTRVSRAPAVTVAPRS